MTGKVGASPGSKKRKKWDDGTLSLRERKDHSHPSFWKLELQNWELLKSFQRLLLESPYQQSFGCSWRRCLSYQTWGVDEFESYVSVALGEPYVLNSSSEFSSNIVCQQSSWTRVNRCFAERDKWYQIEGTLFSEECDAPYSALWFHHHTKIQSWKSLEWESYQMFMATKDSWADSPRKLETP